MHGTRECLGLALRQALKARDTIAVSALRSALSANAEAVDAAGPPAGGRRQAAASTSLARRAACVQAMWHGAR